MALFSLPFLLLSVVCKSVVWLSKLGLWLCGLNWLFGDPITVRFFVAHASQTFGPHRRIRPEKLFKVELSPQELTVRRIKEEIRRIVEDLPDCKEFPQYADLRIFQVTANGGLRDVTRFDERLSRKDARSLREDSDEPILHANNTVDVAAVYVDHLVPQIPPGVNLAQAARQETLNRAMSASTPSKLAKKSLGKALSDHFVVLERARPLDDTAPDPSIYSPPLARLSQTLQDVQPVPDHQILDIVAELCSLSAISYRTEDDRYKAVAPIIAKLFGVELVKEYKISYEREEPCQSDSQLGRRKRRRVDPPGARANGAVVATVRRDGNLILVLVLKNVLGMGNFQATMTHVKKLALQASETPCATIFLAVFGPAIHIACGLLADVYTSKPIIANWFPLVGTTSEQTREIITNLARIIPAVRQAIADLDSTATRPTPLLPSPTLLVDGLDRLSLGDLTFLDRLSGDTSRSLFRATYRGRSALVKFCDRYDTRAHDRLARHDLAPTLHGVAHVVGGLRMVVMAFDPEMRSAYDQYFGRELPEGVVAEVDRALALLRRRDPTNVSVNRDNMLVLVHGDVRRENILVPRNPDRATRARVHLVGFRWSGEEGRVCYPCDLFLDDVRTKLGLRAGDRIVSDDDKLMRSGMSTQYD